MYSRPKKPDKWNTRASPEIGGISETLSLVRGNQLNYAIIIRLAPDLLDEIKRLEARGAHSRIKFHASSNNPAGNVIDVGGKDFRFTWSHEPGDLCDVYEERKSGEDCNGTLIESGGAWRKLNVQRVLDESTKNHVKMLSEEAERKLKSRKAIVLDPGNPSMKNQMKALAAAETTPWRNFKQKKEPPLKKRKPDLPSGGPSKSMYKSGLLTTLTKGRYSSSPLSSPPEQSVIPAPPVLNNNHNKGHTSMETIFRHEATNKSNSSEDFPSKVKRSAGLNKRGRKLEVEKSPDLRSMLISLLRETPSGMSFKALEKAVADAFPNSVKQIEPIIKKIATYQAPGKYLLKPVVDVESSKTISPLDGRSQLDNHNRSSPRPLAPGPELPMRPDSNDVEEMQKIGSTPEERTNDFNKIDVKHESADIFSEKRISDSEKKISDSERPVASSSDSGTDSDSDSHDSGSPSRSKSRSPVASGSGSSSDSENDASSNSKEASDEEVDIMWSDDDKEKSKELQSSEPGESKSPFEWKTTDRDLVNISTNEKHDDHVLDVVDFEVGELCEPLTEDNPSFEKHFERNGSFDKSKNKPTSSKYWNSDIHKGKSSGRLSSDSRNTRAPKATLPISSIVEGSKRKRLDHYANDSTPHHHRIGQPETEQNHSRVEGVNPTQNNNSNIECDAFTGLGSASLVEQNDSRQAGITPSSREKRKHQTTTSGNDHDKRKDPSQTESNGGVRKRRESSSDENCSPYSKYQREDPELKGQIKDLSQYEEYVKEYVEKYDSYKSLNKMLESYRDEFSQVAKDFEAAEGRDMARYYDLVAQLHKWYHQRGVKVKRLKKIFVVLHEELKCLKQMMKDFAVLYAKH